MSRGGLVAPVSGFSASILATALALMHQKYPVIQAPAPLLRELAATERAIRAADAEWREARASADGNAEVVDAEIEAPSVVVDVDTAAGRIGLTPRRVRQLIALGDLVAEKRGGAWLVDQTSIEVLRAGRQAS